MDGLNSNLRQDLAVENEVDSKDPNQQDDTALTESAAEQQSLPDMIHASAASILQSRRSLQRSAVSSQSSFQGGTVEEGIRANNDATEEEVEGLAHFGGAELVEVLEVAEPGAGGQRQRHV